MFANRELALALSTSPRLRSTSRASFERGHCARPGPQASRSRWLTGARARGADGRASAALRRHATRRACASRAGTTATAQSSLGLRTRSRTRAWRGRSFTRADRSRCYPCSTTRKAAIAVRLSGPSPRTMRRALCECPRRVHRRTTGGWRCPRDIGWPLRARASRSASPHRAIVAERLRLSGRRARILRRRQGLNWLRDAAALIEVISDCMSSASSRARILGSL